MRRTTSVLTAIVLVAGTAACGSGGGGGAAGAAVDDWVDGVCGRMMALDHELSSEQSDFTVTWSSTSDTTVTLDALDGYLTSVAGFVRLASGDISRLGAPAIADKNAVLSDVDDLFYTYENNAADIGNSVKQALGDPSTTHLQALTLIGELGRLGDPGEGMQSILNDYRDLRTSFEDSSTCQRWVDRSSTATTVPAATTTAPPETAAPTTTVEPTTTVPPTTLPPTTLPPTTPPPTAPPVTTDPYAIARDMYTAAADEYNPKFDLVYDTFWGTDNFILFKDAPVYCSQYGTLMSEWNDRMGAILWPADAQDEANIHITEGQILIGMLDQCAATPGTRAGVDQLLTDIESQENTYYATVDPLRIAIGLPALYGE